MPENSSPYRPSAFYWRRAIRSASKQELIEINLALVAELEAHKAAIRELGYIPPKGCALPEEMREKGWSAEIIRPVFGK